MNINFPFILVVLTITSGLIWLIHSIFFKGKFIKTNDQSSNPEAQIKAPKIVEYARGLFPVFLIVLIIRSFLIQPYYVASGSLEPTIMTGDFIALNHFAYGLHLPVINKKFINIEDPKTGDIALFHWPVNQNKDFIKRVIGVPGDDISYINKVLYINGKAMPQKFIGYATDNGNGHIWKVKVMQENLNGVKHKIYVCPKISTSTLSDGCPNPNPHNFFNLVVPKGMYFMMGDNRDNSDDSRDWGFVPEQDLVGKGMFVWMNWDSKQHTIHWSHIGRVL